MINYNFKNRIFYFFSKSFLVLGFFLFFNNTVLATETYIPFENITIGEFIYNDDYTPTADDCSISIYSPSLVELVNTTMTDEGAVAVTGWHYYPYTIPVTEGKYPVFITCGSILSGDLFKLDKSFVVKAPVVTDSSIAAAVDVNTSAGISNAVTAINSNTDTRTGSLATTLSSLPATIWGYTSRTLTSFGSLVSDIATSVWASPNRSLTTFGTLVADVWSNTTRTITGGTTTANNMLTASDVWTYGTRNLTDGTLTSGSLAKVSDLSGIATATNVTDATSGLATAAGLTAATSPLATTAQLNSAVSPLATSAILALVKTNTDNINWTDITDIKSNTNTLITEIGTGNITGIKTKTDSIDWTDIDSLITSSGDIKTKTDSIDWSNITAIKTKTDSIAWADVTGIKTKTDTILWSDIATLATTAQLAPLATAAGLTAATSPLATATGLTAATSPLATATGLTTATTNLVTNSQLATALSPIATGADVTSSTNTIVSAIGAVPLNVWNYTTRTLTSFGSLVSDIVSGVWSAVTRTLTTIPGTPEVKIISILDTTSPSISASVTIKNESYEEYEYQYEWCISSAPDEDCLNAVSGTHNTAARKLLPGEILNTVLNVNHPTSGNFYFIVVVPYGANNNTLFSYSRMPFTSTSIVSPPGGGGGGGDAPLPQEAKCGRADFNCDKKVNSIDFSILLYYWKSAPPFKNQYVDINKDNKVDSVDFSILLYEWGKNY